MPVAEVLFCPLAGINCNIPHKIEVKNYRSFRPLAGINCNIMKAIGKLSVIGFRPLVGINCNRFQNLKRDGHICFRPLAGNSLDIKKHGQTTDVFRPPEGCSFTIPHIESKEKNYTPEKRGWSRKDKA